MTQYDNTNTGTFWGPHDNQQFVGQGKLNINGREDRIVVVRKPVKRDGEPQLVLYKKIGVLFPNDKKGNDKAPDYSGPVDAVGADMRLAGWAGEKDGRRYMSLKAQPKQTQGQGGGSYDQSPQGGQGKGGARPSFPDDDIPF